MDASSDDDRSPSPIRRALAKPSAVTTDQTTAINAPPSSPSFPQISHSYRPTATPITSEPTRMNNNTKLVSRPGLWSQEAAAMDKAKGAAAAASATTTTTATATTAAATNTTAMPSSAIGDAPSPLSILSSAKSLPNYRHDRKFTYFSLRTDILQSDSLYTLSDSESLARLMAEPSYWIDVCQPNSADLTTVGEVFGLHPLTVEDVLVRDNREKCEIYDKYLFLCIRTCDQGYYPSPPSHHLHRPPPPFGNAAATTTTTKSTDHAGTIDTASPWPIGITTSVSSAVPSVLAAGTLYPTGTVDSVNLYILMFPAFVLSIHSEPIPHIRHVFRRLYAMRPVFSFTADWTMYALLDDVVDEFMPNMRSMELEVDSIDDLVLVLKQSDQADMLRRIARARKRVTHLQRLLKPKSEVIKVLTKRCPDRLHDAMLLYLRDIQDHVLTMIQDLDQSSATLDRSHSNYLGQINIELTESSNRTNYIVKKLTAATSLVLPLSLVSGIWGMNVPVPGQVGTRWVEYGPFFVICTAMIALMALMFGLGRRYDWI